MDIFDKKLNVNWLTEKMKAQPGSNLSRVFTNSFYIRDGLGVDSLF